jgi:hypothetical protein
MSASEFLHTKQQNNTSETSSQVRNVMSFATYSTVQTWSSTILGAERRDGLSAGLVRLALRPWYA